MTTSAFTAVVNEYTPAGAPKTKGQTNNAVPLKSVQAALTALSGGGQTGATLLPRILNEVTTVAADNDSVILPVSVAGMIVYVANASASHSMNVFPASGEKINGGSANAAFAVASAKRAAFFCVVAGNWYSMLTA